MGYNRIIATSSICAFDKGWLDSKFVGELALCDWSDYFFFFGVTCLSFNNGHTLGCSIFVIDVLRLGLLLCWVMPGI